MLIINVKHMKSNTCCMVKSPFTPIPKCTVFSSKLYLHKLAKFISLIGLPILVLLQMKGHSTDVFMKFK